MSVYIKARTGATGRRFVVYYRRGGRGFPEEYAGSFRTATEARTRRDLVAGELAAARDPRLLLEELRAPRVRPSGLLKVWDDCVRSRIDLAAKTREVYGSARNRIVPILGETRDPASISPADVQVTIAALLEDLSPSTVRHYVSKLGLVLDYADVTPNPVHSKKVRLPAEDMEELSPPSTAEWLATRGVLRPRFVLLADTVEACGLRIGEALGLEYGDVDFAGRRFRVRRATTKTRSGVRWLPAPDLLLDEIDGLVALEDRHAARRVFTVSADAFRTELERATRLAGVPYFTPHELRHRRISLWFAHGIDQVQIRVWAGHAKASTSSDTYGHVLIDASADRWREFWMTGVGRPAGAAQVRHRSDDE